MLQLIRDRFTGVVAFIVIGAIGVTLVISFGNMDQGGVAGNFAAEVNGEEVDMRSYQRAVQNQLLRQQDALQGELPEFLQEQIQRNTLEGLVRNKVVTQYVRDAGYRVDDQRLSIAISSRPVFQIDGAFSRESYIAVLASQGISPEFYEHEQRAQLEVGQLQNAILYTSFLTPREYRRYIELLAEEREATSIVLDPAELADGIEITDAELQVYYEANADEFRTQESVSLDYIEIRLADIAARISVDEQAVRDYYDANADRYVAEEQRQGRHILLIINDDTEEAAARTQANELHQRLLDGESFEELAREYSDDPVSAEQGGGLGWASRSDYVDAFAEVLFGLDTGAISEPVRTEFGYHIIRLDAVNSGALRSYAEVRDELFDELRNRQAEDGFYALAERVDDLALENPTSLSTVESDTDLKVQRIEQFTRNGGPPFGYNAAMVDAAFSLAVLDDRENSPLIEVTEDTAVVLRVDEHQPSVVPPLEEVREQVEASVRLQKAGDLAQGRGKQILAQLETGESAEAVATQFDVKLQKLATLKRSSNEVAPEMLAEIYRMPHPVDDAGVYRGLQLANGGYAVLRLDKVVAGRAAAIPQEARDQRKQQLAQQSGNNTVTALVVDLREKAKVVIAPDLFDKPETF